jgi:hypothetical protein
MRRRSIALLGALLLAASLAVSPTVLAVWPPGTVTVETNGCTFRVHIDLESATPVVGWEVKASTETSWDSGTTILHGSGSSDANGVLDVGPFTADAGEYNVIVDDETPVDASSIVKHFTLACEAASAPPSEAPSAPPSEAPSASTAPSGSELPAEGSPSPTGGEEGLTGTPPRGGGAGLNATPPPTDTAVTGQTAGSGAAPAILLAIIGLAAAVFTSTRRFGRPGIRTRRQR